MTTTDITWRCPRCRQTVRTYITLKYTPLCHRHGRNITQMEPVK